MSTQVLYISYDGMTDPLGQSQVIPYLEGLSKLGYVITLISFEKQERSKFKESISQKLRQAGIDWHPLVYTKKPPIISTLYDLTRMSSLARQLHRKKNFSIVHCRSYISALAGLWLKKRYSVLFLFDMRGFYADERVDGKIWNLNNPLYRCIYHYFKYSEKKFLQHADYTISLTHAGKREIHSWCGIKGQPVPIEVIPCCADVNHFSEKNIDMDKAKKISGELNSSFVLCYVGSMGTWYMPDEMFDFFKVLLTYKPDAKFLILTTDIQQQIYALAEKKGINKKNVFITEATREELPTYLSVCNLSVFFIKPVFSKKASSPTKHGELMSMGIPLVANDNVGDVGDIIRSTRSGVVISEFTESAYHRAVEQVLSTSFDKKSIAEQAEKVYGLDSGVKTYDKVYQTILKTKYPH